MQNTYLYKEAARRYEEITKSCLRIENRISKYPPGKIHIVKSKGKVQYYLRTDSNDKSGKYIPKSEKQKIRVLLQKKYDEKLYDLLKTEKVNLEKLLKKTVNSVMKIQSLYSDLPREVKVVIEPIDVSDDDYVQEWIADVYEGKGVDSDVPVYITDKGERVRSKSELNIANHLHKEKIPYKYECPLTLTNGRVIYPDFTVLNVKRRKVIFWEHRGMMDDREYAKHAVQRVKVLAKEGIVLGDNLLLTEETQTNPLGTDEIERIIQFWFRNDVK